MKIIAIILVIALSLIAVNCQIPAIFVFSTFNDTACNTPIDMSYESSGKCLTVGGGASANITLNGTTSGNIYQYSSPGCSSGSVSNTSFTVGACTRLTGAGSFKVTLNTQIWTFSSLYQSTSSCTTSGTLVIQSNYLVTNITGAMCTFTTCNCFGPICTNTVCGTSTSTCDPTLYAQAATYNQAGCAASALTATGCTKPNTCINYAGNTSSIIMCSGGSATGGGGYNRPNCGSGGGNITAGNYTVGCGNNGQGFYLTFSCTQSTTAATTSTGGTTGATTSSAAVVTFSILAVIAMIVLSLIF